MKINLARKARQQLSKLPHNEQKKAVRKLRLLEPAPFLGKALAGELSGIYSLKAWPYRILYMVDKKKKRIVVIAIQHRQGAYG